MAISCSIRMISERLCLGVRSKMSDHSTLTDAYCAYSRRYRERADGSVESRKTVYTNLNIVL
jgi:hypothetical protein